VTDTTGGKTRQEVPREASAVPGRESRWFLTGLAGFFLISCLVVLTPRVQTNDDIGYFAQVRSWVMDGSLDLAGEYRYYRSQGCRFKSILRDPVTGRFASQYPVGVPLLQAPFFLVGHGIALAIGDRSGGYGEPYVRLVGVGSAVYGFLGLLMIFVMLRGVFGARASALSVTGIWLCTGLYFYMFIQPMVSHAYSFFAVTLFVFVWFRTLRDGDGFSLDRAGQRTPRQWFLLGALGGLAVLVRYQDGIFLSVLILEYLARALPCLRERRPGKAFGLLGGYLVSVAGFLVVLAPQGLLLLHQHRSLSVLNHYGNYFGHDTGPPTPWAVLFGSNRGLFHWHPFLLAGLAGLVASLCSGNRELRFTGISGITVLLMASAISLWWGNGSVGQAFGHRFFLSCYPFLAWGTACLLHRLPPGRQSLFIPAGALALFAVWNFGLMVLYGARMIATDGPVTLGEMAANLFGRLPGELLDILWRFAFHRSSFP
jgi:hypothetical protein